MSKLYGLVADGKILRTFTFNGSIDELLLVEPGAVLLPSGVTPHTHFFSGGLCLPMPVRPGEYYYFDYAAGMWLVDEIAAWASIRAKRDNLLSQCDWTQLPDVSAITKEAWASYRQALRDITAQVGFPDNIDWPTPP